MAEDKENMMDIQQVCMELITHAGMAKSCYMDAVKAAKKGEIRSAREKIEEGEQQFLSGHQIHLQMLSSDSKEEFDSLKQLLLMHSEDQMMSAETVKLFALELIDLYEQKFGEK